MATQSYFPEPNQPSSSAPASSGGSVLTPGSGAPAGGSKKGSGFVNLDTYLNANRGNTTGLADTISNSYAGEVDKFNANLDSVKQAEANRLSSGAGVSGAPKYDYSQKYFDLSGNAISEDQARNARSVDQNTVDMYNQHDRQTMQNRLDELNRANPFSPAGLSNSAQVGLAQADMQAAQLGNRRDSLLNDRGAQAQVLANQFNNNGNYNRGFAALDSFLLNADQQASVKAGGSNRLQQGLDRMVGLTAKTSDVRNSLNNTAQDAANRQWQGLKNTAQSALGASQMGFQAPQEKAAPQVTPISSVPQASGDLGWGPSYSNPSNLGWGPSYSAPSAAAKPKTQSQPRGGQPAQPVRGR
jgi:hypothetical protein